MSAVLPPRASVSQIQTFNRCKFKFWLRYIKKFSGSSVFQGQVRGTLLHEAYDRYLFTGRNVEEAYNQMEKVRLDYLAKGSSMSIMDKALEEASLVLKHYLPYADKADDFKVVIPYKGQQQCETEGEVSVKLPDGTWKPFFYKIDTMIMKNEQLMMMEHKFRKNLDKNGLEHDFQIGAYNAAWNSLHPDYTLNGVLYNIVSAKPRKADGVIAIREYQYRGPVEVGRILSNIGSQMYEMKRAAEDPTQVWPLNPKTDCSWDCDMVIACLSIRAGSKLKDMVDNGLLRTSERKSRELSSEEDPLVFSPVALD